MRRIIVTLAALSLAAMHAAPAAAQGGIVGRLRGAVGGAASGSFAMSLEKERQIGREVAAVVAGRWPPVTNAALTDYVNLVGAWWRSSRRATPSSPSASRCSTPTRSTPSPRRADTSS